jgi:Tfp pilus assembly protein PilO
VKFRGEIWRQRLWVWLPALLFFLANLGAFAVYKLGYAGRVESLQSTLDVQKQTLSQLAAKQQESRIMLARVETNKQQVKQLYAERLSTRSRRLTGITAEVKEIARKTGLVPRTFTYPEEEFQEYGLIKRSFVFNANGTYSELRKFISLLEASPSFLSLDELTVTSSAQSQGQELNIALSLSTLFASDAEEGTQAPAAAGPNGAAAVSGGLSSRGTPGGAR